jgi:hypothetical protein
MPTPNWPDAPAPGSAATRPLPALILALAARQVRYCHWKSNVRLAESLAGREDLDLLVDRPDALAFFAALAESGYKLAQTRHGGGHPGVLHAFALDPGTLRLVHVHAYFRVATGDSLVKSFLLPFDDLLLDASPGPGGLPVPPPEVELVVFLLRILLKHTGAIETLFLHRSYRAVPPELAWLVARADAAAARALWVARLPGGTPEGFEALLAAVADPAAVAARIRHGVALGWRLRGWRRIRPLPALASRLRRLGLLAWGRLRHRRPHGLRTGGAIIALVGPKASGKSTLAGFVHERLGEQLDIRRIHVGKPPATPLTLPIRLLLPLLRRLMPGERSGAYQKPQRRADMRYSFAYVVRMLVVAHERRSLLFRSFRAASAGALLIADRYPSGDVGASDSCQFGAAALAGASGPKRALMRLEQACYAGLPQPDLVVRLSAPVEVTVERDATRTKADAPDADTVRWRRDIETSAHFPGIPELMVNTDSPLERTCSEVLEGIWGRL